MKKILSVFLSCLIIFTGCAHLNTKDDYSASLSSLATNDINSAISNLPSGEGNTFITVMEKTYLNLLLGKPKMDKLREMAVAIDNQIQYKVSRGVKSFFFAETPEGYYASEHEIIWMHYLLCWGYAILGKKEEARVEAKKASTLLGQNFTNASNGRFDDPFMRIISSLMWMFCDEWDEAKVDLRRALVLDPKLKWIKKLVTLDEMPESIFFVMGGTGYEPKWDVDKKRLVRGFRNISFTGNGLKSTLHYINKKNRDNMSISPDSSQWYKRHINRNTVVSDMIDDTKYVEKFGYSSTKMAGHITLAVIGGLAIFTLGLGIGGALLYIGIAGNSSEVAGLGIASILMGGKFGYDFAESNIEDARDNYNEEMDPSISYRYVRFLPEYAWMGWNDNIPDSVNFLKGNSKLDLTYSSIKTGKKEIIIAYYADRK